MIDSPLDRSGAVDTVDSVDPLLHPAGVAPHTAQLVGSWLKARPKKEGPSRHALRVARKADRKDLLAEADAQRRTRARSHHPTAFVTPPSEPSGIIDPHLRRAAPSATAAATAAMQAKPRRRLLRRAFWPLVASVVLAGGLLTFVFPTRALLAQRQATKATEHQLAELRDENNALEAQIGALNTDAEIERIAREQYNLVRPGEEALAVLPPPPPSELPSGFPYDTIRGRLAQLKQG